LKKTGKHRAMRIGKAKGEENTAAGKEARRATRRQVGKT